MSKKKNPTKKRKKKAGQWFPLATGCTMTILRTTAHMNQPGHRGAATFL